ncbi:hypothetical protein O4H49_07425 [Kiloniella laminariae]|uniref:Uncharacterized protein n=1 Tax=Kiloniella laminariae TaxID=454162 RepID=A0ABT4LHM5_9PROT|nr:hypothetical protein [Kiloniella laminariae]MCZ4280603.1 hypothetical protein [Kiloniella laminariae]
MTDISQNKTAGLRDFPSLYWLWLPLLMVVIMVIGRTIFPDWTEYEHYFEGERRGIVENAAFVVLVAAVVFGSLSWLKRESLPSKYLGHWLLLCTVAVFIAAGEEASWGQHWFQWATPEGLAAINDHNETNFHNTLNGHDSTIKTIIMIGMAIGTIIIPLIIRFGFLRKPVVGSDLYWLFPTVVGLPVTLYCLASRLLKQTFQKWTDLGELQYFDMDFNELSEFYVACFLFFYLFSFWYRLRQSK